MPTARQGAAVVGYQSMLIVVRGNGKVEGKWTILATTELLDTTNGCWYICDDLPVAHHQLRFTVMANCLYLLGGYHKNKPSPQVFTVSLDNLSSHQLKWQSFPDTPRCCSAPVVLYDKFLCIVGGRQTTTTEVGAKTTKVCAFNPSNGLWQQITNIPAAGSFPAVVGVVDNKIIVLGGLTQQNVYSNKVLVGLLL
ncbi:kelch domain-containing protein 8B-like [Dysidea avara]|uniref:kelch domain-containing protein 8B-like n=1 Tax=Dysidea avara TaxID=196820 RepID=UPI00332C5372